MGIALTNTDDIAIGPIHGLVAREGFLSSISQDDHLQILWCYSKQISILDLLENLDFHYTTKTRNKQKTKVSMEILGSTLLHVSETLFKWSMTCETRTISKSLF